MYLHVFIYSIYVSNTVRYSWTNDALVSRFSSCFSLPIWLKLLTIADDIQMFVDKKAEALFIILVYYGFSFV